MKDLRQYIIESHDSFVDDLDFKIAYRSEWDKDGTHYTRRVTVKCSGEQLAELNKRISGHLEFGDNFAKLTVSRAFDVLIGQDAKAAGQHNTIFKIVKK